MRARTTIVPFVLLNKYGNLLFGHVLDFVILRTQIEDQSPDL